jgi:hypothetical protein
MTTTMLPISPAEHPCYVCGDLVHMVAAENNEWMWAGRDEKITGLMPIFRHLDVHPYERLKQLGDEITAFFKLPKGKQTPELWAAQNRAFAEYNPLKVRLDMGGTFHTHTVIGSTLPVEVADARKAIEHCDYPAYRRPLGWECRVCGKDMGDDEAVGFTLPATEPDIAA